jgi:hypothetical protein
MNDHHANVPVQPLLDVLKTNYYYPPTDHQILNEVGVKIQGLLVSNNEYFVKAREGLGSDKDLLDEACQNTWVDILKGVWNQNDKDGFTWLVSVFRNACKATLRNSGRVEGRNLATRETVFKAKRLKDLKGQDPILDKGFSIPSRQAPETYRHRKRDKAVLEALSATFGVDYCGQLEDACLTGCDLPSLPPVLVDSSHD